MPEFILDEHRLRVPIDHPDGSITPLKLAFATWEKIVEVDVPSGTRAVDITGLNGDVDKVYAIFFEGALEGTATTDWYLVVIPNALSLTIDNIGWCAAFDGSSAGGGVWHPVLPGFMLGRTGWSVAGHMIAIGFLVAKTGYRRQWFAFYHIDSPARATTAHHCGFQGAFWDDTTTVITSLRIATNANTFSGKLILFRVSR